MTGSKTDQPPISCAECRATLQEYLDGTLPKTESIRVFLHLRECTGCQSAHEEWQATFGLLDTLPALEAPTDFDRKVLAAVPYASYRAMAELRRPRLPVVLAEETIPAWVRSPVTRLAGVVIAAGAGLAMGWFQAPPTFAYGVVLGLLPEGVVRLQGMLRGAALALRRSGG